MNLDTFFDNIINTNLVDCNNISFIPYYKSQNILEHNSKYYEYIYTLNIKDVMYMNDNKLKKFKNLRYLDCGKNTNFTDKGIKNLPLSHLDCGKNTNFTDKGIKNLPLSYLDCGVNTNFTDKGIKNLPLSYLDCGVNTNFTYECLNILSLEIFNKGSILNKIYLNWNTY